MTMITGIEKLSSVNGDQMVESLRESKRTPESEPQVGGGSGESSITFGDFLKSAIHDSNEAQITANKAAEELISGRNKDLHGTMLQLEKADLQFRLLTQVRNKVLDAYREIMKMQV